MGTPASISPDRLCARAATPTTDEFARAFFAEAPDCIRSVRESLFIVGLSADDALREEKLAEIYVAISALLREAQSARITVAFRLLSNTLALLKELVERTNLATPAALDKTAAALDQLQEFCETTVRKASV